MELNDSTTVGVRLLLGRGNDLLRLTQMTSLLGASRFDGQGGIDEVVTNYVVAPDVPLSEIEFVNFEIESRFLSPGAAQRT